MATKKRARDPEKLKEYRARWAKRNPDLAKKDRHTRAYKREYMRAWRARKKAEKECLSISKTNERI